MYVTVDDMVAFQRHCVMTRPIGRKSLRQSRFVNVALAVALLIFIQRPILPAGADPYGWVFWLMAMTASTIVWFTLPGTLLRAYRRAQLRRTPGGVKPLCRVWVDELGINDESAERFTRYSWSSVESVDETETHAFVWVGEGLALVLPKTVGQPQLQAFLAAVRSGIAATGARSTGLV